MLMYCITYVFHFYYPLCCFSSLDGKMVVLVSNAMYWNNNWQTYPLWDEIAERQLQWLEEQLALAKNEGKRVLIMSHIPPG